mgnify:CR=1 FL=1
MSVLLRKHKIFNLDNSLDESKNEKDYSSKELKEKKEKSSLVVGSGVTINGSIVAKEEVVIIGKVEADVEAKKIIVGSNGEINGKIKTSILEIEGKVNGEIDVENTIKIMASGKIEGKISYQKLEVQEGGTVKGELIIKEMKQEEFKDWKSL